MLKQTAKWKGNDAVILETFDATELLQAPFKVHLLNAVKQVLDGDGSALEIIIPDPQGLVKAVAQARVLHPHKLSGVELKFLRTALGLKSKELATAIAVSPEHMSRLESGDKVLCPQSEMLVRIFTFVSTLRFTTKKQAGADTVAEHVAKVFSGLSIKPCRPIEDEVVLVLGRVPRAPDKELDETAETGLWTPLQHDLVKPESRAAPVERFFRSHVNLH